MIWFQFIISAVVIFAAGTRLTRYADELCDALNLGRVWIGVVLLGLVTSLPEAGSSMAAVVSLGAHDLAVGNMAGSNNFNLVLIVLLDLIYPKGCVTNLVRYNRGHAVPALFAVVLSVVVIFEIALTRVIAVPRFLGMSAGSILVVVVYFWGMRRVYQANPGVLAGNGTQAGRQNSIGKIYTGLGVSAFFVVAAAVWLANAADAIALDTGLGRTFVGSLLLAMATSLPEMVVTLSALKLGQTDLAIGNIFGSNMVNMFLLALCDPLVRGRALLQEVSAAHIWTLSVGIVLTVIVIAGLKQNHKRLIWRMGWDSWTIIVVYAIGVAGLYVMR